MEHFYGNTQAIKPLTVASPVAVDAALANFFHLDFDADVTIGIPSNPKDGQVIILRFTNTHGSLSRTITLTTGSTGAFKFTDTVTALTATPFGKTDRIICEYVLSETRWHVTGYSKGT